MHDNPLKVFLFYVLSFPFSASFLRTGWPGSVLFGYGSYTGQFERFRFSFRTVSPGYGSYTGQFERFRFSFRTVSPPKDCCYSFN